MARRARITHGAEIQRIAREGKRIRTMHLEVRAVASPRVRPAGARARVGFVVPRFKQTAVARNRLKRRLRELSRLHLIPMDFPTDLVLRVRPEAYAATFDALADEIRQVSTRLAQWSAPSADGPAAVPPAPPRPR